MNRIFESFREVNEKISVDGKYLKFKDGSIASLGYPEEGKLVFTDGREDFFVYKTDKDIRLEGNSFDKSFKTINDLVKYLNKNNMRYIGID